MSAKLCNPLVERGTPKDTVDGCDDSGGVGMAVCTGVDAGVLKIETLESATLGDCNGDWKASWE